MNKPSNWYQMDWQEQREWKRQEGERDDLEYQARRAQEDAEQARQNARDELSRARRQHSAEQEEMGYVIEEYENTVEDQAKRITELEILLNVATDKLAKVFEREMENKPQAIRIVRLEEALRGISRHAAEWNANKLGGVHLQRKRWQALGEMADHALLAEKPSCQS